MVTVGQLMVLVRNGPINKEAKNICPMSRLISDNAVGLYKNDMIM